MKNQIKKTSSLQKVVNAAIGVALALFALPILAGTFFSDSQLMRNGTPLFSMSRVFATGETTTTTSSDDTTTTTTTTTTSTSLEQLYTDAAGVTLAEAQSVFDTSDFTITCTDTGVTIASSAGTNSFTDEASVAALFGELFGGSAFDSTTGATYEGGVTPADLVAIAKSNALQLALSASAADLLGVDIAAEITEFCGHTGMAFDN